MQSTPDGVGDMNLQKDKHNEKSDSFAQVNVKPSQPPALIPDYDLDMGDFEIDLGSEKIAPALR